jgi:hypothetical protein
MKVMDGGQMVVDTGAGLEAQEPATPDELVVQSLEAQAIEIFVREGTLTAVSRELGIKYHEVQKLSRTLWWADEVSRLKKEQAAGEISMQSRLLNTGLEMLLDRLENGDLVATRSGFKREPLKATDIARIVHTVFTERQLLRNEPTAIAGETGRVQVLADKLRALGAKDITIIDEEGNAQEAS